MSFRYVTLLSVHLASGVSTSFDSLIAQSFQCSSVSLSPETVNNGISNSTYHFENCTHRVHHVVHLIFNVFEAVGGAEKGIWKVAHPQTCHNDEYGCCSLKLDPKDRFDGC